MKENGFTLIELMVVVVIISLLSAIALPSYLGLVNKSKLSQAKTFIRHAMDKEIIHYMESNEFNDSLGTSDMPIEGYTYEVVKFNNHIALDGSRYSGLRYRAIPTNSSLKQVMGKIWVEEGEIRTVMCTSPSSRPFMRSKLYCN